MKIMKKLIKNYVFNICLVLCLGGFVFWLSFKDNYEEVFDMLRNMNPLFFGLGVLVTVLVQLTIGLTLTLLTKISNPHYRLKDGFVNALVASLFHGITPSASGGQFAQIYVYRKQKVDISDAASVLWMDFIIYQATMIAVVFCLLLIRLAYFKKYFSNLLILVILGFLINSCVVVGLFALVKFPKVYTWVTTRGIEIGVKLHLIKNREKVLANIDGQLKRFDSEATKLQQHRKVIVQVVICNIFRLLLYYSIPYFCFLALGINVDIKVLIDIIAMSSFVSMINAFIPIPGASGGTEATFVLMFSSMFGIVNASSSMLLWRILSYYLVLIFGMIAFGYIKLKRE